MSARDDYGTHTVEDAAAAELYMSDAGERERPDLGDAVLRSHSGVCGGCGFHVDPSHPGGSCIHKRGPWHPACRDTDRAGSIELQAAA